MIVEGRPNIVRSNCPTSSTHSFGGLKMKHISHPDNEAQLNKPEDDPSQDDPGQVGPDSAGQSGDAQGLSQTADAADESVEELAVTDQAFEADVISGVEDAADHPERPSRTHMDFRRRVVPRGTV
jgi:hypothetical protein